MSPLKSTEGYVEDWKLPEISKISRRGARGEVWKETSSHSMEGEGGVLEFVLYGSSLVPESATSDVLRPGDARVPSMVPTLIWLVIPLSTVVT